MKKIDDGLYALEVGDLAIKVSPSGAELQSVVRGGREYLWQGDPAYWGRRSPVLFPIVGSLWNGVCRFGGKEYRMSQHGFARDMVFRNVDGGEDDALVFVLGSDAGTAEHFPFGFELYVSYRVEGASVHVGWKVRNVSSGVMPFQIGGHPAFNLPGFEADRDVYGYLGLEPEDAAAGARYILVAERGCVDPLHSWPLPLEEEGLLPLGPHTFDRDALVVEDSGVGRVTLYDAGKKPVLAVSFDAPLFGLWSPAGKRAPFVCIEPWYGRCDRKGYEGEFSGRDYVMSLAPSETFEAGYTIELL